MYALGIGLVCIGLGLAGVRYAPAIVEAQRRQGMAPLEDAAFDETDRLRATNGTVITLVIFGIALAGYGIEIA